MIRKLLALLLLFPALALAQFTVPQSTGAIASGGAAPTRYMANVMGLTEFNNSYAESSNTMDAMQFVYSQFQQQTSMTNPAADTCSAVSGGRIYVIGGYGANASTYLDYVQIYDPTTDSWSQGATIPTATWGGGCALYGGSIYYFGGDTSSVTGTTAAYVYSIAGNSWSTLTSLPVGLPDGVQAVTVGSDIYILFESYFYQFDPSGSGGSGSYTTLTSPPSAAQVQWAATGYVNVSGDDRIYFIGGSTGSSSGYTNVNYYYSVTNAAWSSAQATAPYSAHGELQQAVYNGSIYYIGGYDGNVFYRTLYSYTPSTNTWSSALAAMNGWRDGIAGGFIGNTLYVIGGRNADNGSVFGLAESESFQIGSSPTTQNFTKIQINYNGGSSGNVELGVYTDAGSSGPGSLVLDAGNVAITNGWAVISGLNVSLTPGTYYWLVFIQSSSQPVSYTAGAPQNPNASNAHCYASQAYGALPSSFPGGATCTNSSMYAVKLTVN